MIDFITYNISDGKIIQTGKCQPQLLSAQTTSTGQSVIDGIADLSKSYISGGVVTPRPLFTTSSSWNTTSITANGTSTATFGSTIPSGTVATIIANTAKVASITPITITDGSLNITSNVVGTYDITFSKFPYLDYKVRVTAVPIGSTGMDFQLFSETKYSTKNITYATIGSFTQLGYIF